MQVGDLVKSHTAMGCWYDGALGVVVEINKKSAGSAVGVYFAPKGRRWIQYQYLEVVNAAQGQN